MIELLSIKIFEQYYKGLKEFHLEISSRNESSSEPFPLLYSFNSAGRSADRLKAVSRSGVFQTDPKSPSDFEGPKTKTGISEAFFGGRYGAQAVLKTSDASLITARYMLQKRNASG